MNLRDLIEYMYDEEEQRGTEGYRYKNRDMDPQIPAKGIYTGDMMRTPEFAQENSHTRRINQEWDRRDKREAFLRQRAEARASQRQRVSCCNLFFCSLMKRKSTQSLAWDSSVVAGCILLSAQDIVG